MSQKSSSCSEVISRIAAKQLSLKYFNTGRPCIRGHTNGRFTSTGKCVDCGRSASKLWRQDNREKATAMENNWRAANPEKVQEQKQRFKEARPEYGKEYYAANVEKMAAKMKRTRANNPETFRRNCINYQLRKKQVPGKLSAGIWHKLFIEQDGLCVYCEVDLRCTKSAIDHKNPISLGGHNTDENVQLLCASCNSKKSNTPLEEYERKIGYVRKSI
jgi:5-methylcytosine-specific restriction endonuclease McrA